MKDLKGEEESDGHERAGRKVKCDGANEMGEWA